MEALALPESHASRHVGRLLYMKGRTASQRRYCTCGRELYVNYIPGGKGFTALFRFSAFVGSVLLRECPRCGRTLDIDTVR